jgi:PAS domain S-box-containing protein
MRGPQATLVLALAYYVTGRLGLLLAVPPGYATAVWPPSGLALAGVLLCGYRVWPAIVIASVALNVPIGFDSAHVLDSFAVLTIIALGAAAQAIVGARLIEAMVADPRALLREGDIVRFLVLAGPVSCLVSSTVAVVLLVSKGVVASTSAWLTWSTWWVGDAIGAMLFAPLVLVWLAPSPYATRRHLSVSVPMLTMFLLAVGVYVYAQSLERDRWERDFDRRSSAVLHALRNSLDGYLEALYATQALLLANPGTDAERFHDFAAGFLERHPGLRALGWDSRVRRADRSSFEAAARTEGAADFEIREHDPQGGLVRAADREEHFVVRYVEPLEANRRALGFDIAADATGREVLERARDGAQPVAATSPLAFFQKAGAPGAGILVFCPVYGVWPAPASIEERRATLRGFVVGVFEIGEILRASLRGKPPEGFELSLYEGAALDPSRLLLRVGEVASGGLPQPAGRRLVRSMPVDVGGQRWMLSLAGPAESELSSHSLHVWVAPIGGLLLAALLGALLLILTGRTAFVEAVVRNRTGELEREAVERARATDALRRNEELFRTLATASPIGIFHADAQGRCLYTNPRWQQMSGLTFEQTLGNGYLDAIHPDDRFRILQGRRIFTEAADAPIEFRFLTPSGDVRWVEVRTSAVRSAEGHVVGYVGTVEEVTEQKRAEDALRASEERYRILAEQSSDFIARFGIDGRVTYASPACRTLLGYDPEELVGRSYYDFIHPGDVEGVRGQIRAATGAGLTVSYRVRRRDGEYVWLETTLRVLFHAAGRAASEVVASSRDVSARKRTERMRQDLVAMLSHDLKNPLTAVTGFTEILRELPADDPQRDEFLARIEANAHSALTLAMNFVDASRIESGSLETHPEPVFLNEIVEQVLRHQESRARVKNIRVETRLDRSRPIALLDRRLIDRVVANLVNNAIKFSPAKSEVMVETAMHDGHVQLRVKDQGPGIPLEQRSKLFQRFSELGSDRRDSTGLGLFIVKTLVDAQGGTVVAEFPPEGGTVFELSFPVVG